VVIDRPPMVDECVGLFEWTKASASLWPNPAKDALNITCTGTCEEIIVYDGLGRKIHSAQLSQQVMQIDVHDWPNGIYFLEVRTKENRAQHASFIKTDQ
jgi:hypothetical protein